MVIVVKSPPANAGNLIDVGLIPGLGRSPRGGHGNTLHYSCLENSMDRGAWWATYSPWGCKESDTTEAITCAHTHACARTHTHTHALWLLTYFDVFLPLLMYILIYHINSLHLFSLYVAYFDLIIFSLCPFLFPLTGLKVLNFLTESKI